MILTPIPASLLEKAEGLMFYRDNETLTAPADIPESGPLHRFHRFIYPNLGFEQKPHGEWLEALIHRNGWLR
jgi:hypothetical protein